MEREAVPETPIESTESSGNVFADLDRPDADELLAKSERVHQITGLIRRRGLTQKAAAALLGTTQPIVSDPISAGGWTASRSSGCSRSSTALTATFRSSSGPNPGHAARLP